MSREICLTQGKTAIVDNRDFAWLNQWKWCATKICNLWYAVRGISYKNGKRTKIYMHRQILGLKRGDPHEGDHKDGDGLNNRRKNLRIATPAQNQYNRKLQRGISQYKGVSWHRHVMKWRAQIHINGQATFLGYFDNEIEAAKTYDTAAKLFFGKFAHTNF